MQLVRKYALAYLWREIDAEQFLDWLSDVVSPVGGVRLSPQEMVLAREVELRAAEFTGGYLSEEDFCRFLSELL